MRHFLATLFREVAVFRNRLLNPLDTGLRLRSGALSTVDSAASVRHGRTLTLRPAPRLRATPGRLGEVAGRVPVFQPAAVHSICLYSSLLFPAVHGVYVKIPARALTGFPGVP